jgi:hypothetical protein
MDIYWILKTLMGKVLVERNEAHQEIFLQLDDIQRQLQEMDQKIDKIVGKEEEMVGEGMEHPQQQVPPSVWHSLVHPTDFSCYLLLVFWFYSHRGSRLSPHLLVAIRITLDIS